MNTESKIAAGCGAAVFDVVLFAFAMLLSTIMGGITGWLVGSWFPYVTDTLRELFNVTLTDFELGATLGFFGSAFRSVSTSN